MFLILAAFVNQSMDNEKTAPTTTVHTRYCEVAFEATRDLVHLDMVRGRGRQSGGNDEKFQRVVNRAD